MTGLGGTTRYRCPLPECGWTTEVLPSDGPMGVEQALRAHADSHSALEYVRALTAAREQVRIGQLGAAEREAILEECRDVLEAAGHNGAHGDDWPLLAPAVLALVADRDQRAAKAAEVLEHVASMMACDSRDWGVWHRDAWLYGILVGWDCKEDHEHDDVCQNGEAMRELAERHGWSDEDVARLRRYHQTVTEVQR